MTPMWIDHVVFGLLAVVFPIWGYFWLRKRKALILAGHDDMRIKMYRRLVVEEWVMAAVLLIGWFALGRGSAAIGLIPRGGTPAWAGYGLAALLCVVLVLQMRSVTRQPEQLEKHRKQLGGLSFILPHTAKELKAFDAVSVTASAPWTSEYTAAVRWWGRRTFATGESTWRSSTRTTTPPSSRACWSPSPRRTA